jgi:hypothetical protein
MRVLVLFAIFLAACLALDSPPLRNAGVKKVAILRTGLRGDYGYGGGDDDGYAEDDDEEESEEDDDKSSSSSSSSSSSGSDSKHCDCPDCTTPEPVTTAPPRETCGIIKSKNNVPLFIASATVAKDGSEMKLPPTGICDCLRGSLQYFPASSNKLADMKGNKIAFRLRQYDGCPDVCVRDEDGHFWKQKDATDIQMYIVQLCENIGTETNCFHYTDVDAGTLEDQATSGAKPDITTSACDTTSPISTSNCVLRVAAISCRGCGPIEGDLIKSSECFAEPTVET